MVLAAPLLTLCHAHIKRGCARKIFRYGSLLPLKLCIQSCNTNTRGGQKVLGKVLLNRITFIDCNEISYI